MITVLDTFSGIGAFTLAAKHIGAKVVAHVEIDKNCQKLLAKHHPESKQLGDIHDVKTEKISEPIDIFCGGSPCQNFSVAGNGAGLAGEESKLWFEYLRLVKALKPEWLVWENVPGALSSNGGFDFLTILRGLDECGYHVAWRVLDAQYFGVPQRRRRIFLVGNLRDGRAAQVLFERESLPGTLKTRPRAWQSSPVAGTLAASASGTARPAGQGNELDFLVFGKKRSTDFEQGISVASSLLSRDKHDYGDLVSVTHRMNHETGKLETIKIDEALLSFAPSHYKRGFGSPMKNAKIANTIQANVGSGFSDTDEHIVSNSLIRRFTPLECERLQGFPDGYTEGFSDSARYSMLGNSIAVPVAKWVFERIIEAQS